MQFSKQCAPMLSAWGQPRGSPASDVSRPRIKETEDTIIGLQEVFPLQSLIKTVLLLKQVLFSSSEASTRISSGIEIIKLFYGYTHTDGTAFHSFIVLSSQLIDCTQIVNLLLYGQDFEDIDPSPNINIELVDQHQECSLSRRRLFLTVSDGYCGRVLHQRSAPGSPLQGHRGRSQSRWWPCR